MKIKPIILAAGMSSRFGSNKLLFGINGKMMYEHILFTIIELCKQDIYLKPLVVTQYEEIQKQLQHFPVDVVYNTNSIDGISTSIITAIEAVNEDCFYMFFAADQPHLLKTSIERFVDEFLRSKKGLGCVGFGEKTGNPCIFSPCYKAHLLSLVGDVGGKSVITLHMEDVYVCKIDEKELADIDILEEV